MASQTDKVMDTAKQALGGQGGGAHVAKEIGKENAEKTEPSSGFVSTSSAKEAVAEATADKTKST